MAHPINDLINRREKRKAIPCSKDCEYFKFPHLDRACVLSDVFSVLQGQPCYEFKLKATEQTDARAARRRGPVILTLG